MKYNIFALHHRAPREKTVAFGNTTLRVMCGGGAVTIKDKAYLIWLMSQFKTHDPNRTTPYTARVSMYRLLEQTGQQNGGKEAQSAMDALVRLTATSCVATTTLPDAVTHEKSFHLLRFEAVSRDDARAKCELELTLSPWFAHQIVSKRALSVPREYFQIKGNLERRCYELARVSADIRPWPWKLCTLYERVGAIQDLRRFKLNIKQLAERNTLLGHQLLFSSERNKVVFGRRDASTAAMEEAMGRDALCDFDE